MTEQERWLIQQRGGLLGGSRPIPGMFSNAQMMGGARGGGGIPMGMSSTTTGPEDPVAREDPMMTAMKMKMMYEGGQKGKKYIGDAWDWGKKQLGTQAVSPPVASPSVPGAVQDVTRGASFGSPEITQFNEGINPNFGGPMDQVVRPASGGFVPGGATSLRSPSTGLGGIPVNNPLEEAMFFGAEPSQVSNWGGLFPSGATGTTNAAGVFTPSASTIAESGGLLEGLGAGGSYAGTGLEGGSELMFSNAPKGGAGFGNALGALGSAAGVGMNIYDMFDQGVTPGNMMGMLGSGMLGASALGSMGVMSGATAGLGLANAWNPIGWALLGGSIAGSLFDWW